MRIVWLSIFITLLLSCSKEDFGPQRNRDNGSVGKVTQGALVLNEGNFGHGNSSISRINWSTGEVENNVYTNANFGASVGDVLQSAITTHTEVYLIVNNSNTVVVLDLITLVEKKRISISGGPRYGVLIGGEIWLGSMGGGKIVAIDTSNYSTRDVMNFLGWCEELVVEDDLLYAIDRRNDRVAQISISQEKVLHNINIGIDPESIALTNEGVFVLTTGGFGVNDREQAAIFEISSGTAVRKWTSADIEASPTRLRASNDGSKLYYLDSGVWQIDQLNEFRPKLIYAQKSGQLFYGLSVRPDNNGLWVSDAKDYVSKGSVIALTEEGNSEVEHAVGVIPQAVIFY